MVALGGGEKGYFRNSGLADTLLCMKQIHRAYRIAQETAVSVLS